MVVVVAIGLLFEFKFVGLRGFFLENRPFLALINSASGFEGGPVNELLTLWFVEELATTA